MTYHLFRDIEDKTGNTIVVLSYHLLQYDNAVSACNSIVLYKKEIKALPLLSIYSFLAGFITRLNMLTVLKTCIYTLCLKQGFDLYKRYK